MAVGEREAGLEKARDDVVVGIAKHVAVTEFDGAGVALGDARDHVDLLVRHAIGGQVGYPLGVCGLMTARGGDPCRFSWSEKAACIRGAKLDDASGAAAPVERRGGASEDLDPFEQARIDEESSVVRGAEVLPRAVDGDNDVGAPEAPDAGRLSGATRPSRELHARHESQDIVGCGRRPRLNFASTNHGDHAGVLEGLQGIARGGDGDGRESNRLAVIDLSSDRCREPGAHHDDERGANDAS